MLVFGDCQVQILDHLILRLPLIFCYYIQYNNIIYIHIHPSWPLQYVMYTLLNKRVIHTPIIHTHTVYTGTHIHWQYQCYTWQRYFRRYQWSDKWPQYQIPLTEWRDRGECMNTMMWHGGEIGTLFNMGCNTVKRTGRVE